MGKTGVGKSAAANTILGREAFTSEPSSSSVTSHCDKARGEVDGREVAMIDTPGLFDTGRSNVEIIQEIVKCISFSAPGPHVFLIVVQLGRFTKEEQDTVEIIQETFGAESAKHSMVLFTRGDDLNNKTIEQFVSRSTTLEKFTSQCHGGYHVFNNKDMQNRSQVSELLQKIDKAVERNGGGWYTNEMYKEAEKAIEKKKMELMKDKRMSEKKAREQAEKDNDFVNKVIVGGAAGAGAVAGLAAGAGAAYAGAEIGALAGAALGPVGAVVGAGLGAGVGGAIVLIKASKNCTIQ